MSSLVNSSSAPYAQTHLFLSLLALQHDQEEEEMGENHELAGAVSKMMKGGSVGGSTLGTDDVTQGPDFISLDGSAPAASEIEMERPATPEAAESGPASHPPTPESPYAM